MHSSNQLPSSMLELSIAQELVEAPDDPRAQSLPEIAAAVALGEVYEERGQPELARQAYRQALGRYLQADDPFGADRMRAKLVRLRRAQQRCRHP